MLVSLQLELHVCTHRDISPHGPHISTDLIPLDMHSQHREPQRLQSCLLTMASSQASGSPHVPPSFTFVLRKDLPQSYKALIERGYIRECYDEYYSMVWAFVDEGRTKIVVTGTPGIGKSIFYMYFFERTIVERPERRVVVAAFNKNRKLMKCKEWKDGKLITLEKMPLGNEGDLFLFDGPPEFAPADATMICFTSPNMDFLQEMIKFTAAYRLRYMPNWTLQEQRCARDVLQLRINDAKLRQRWGYFGGTVRYTFENDLEAVKVAAKDVKKALGKIKSMRQLALCFDGDGPDDMVVHRLLHYVVKDKDDIDGSLRPASRLIAYEMTKKLEKDLISDREKLMKWLEGAGHASTFLGWLFENVAHETLLAGVNTNIRNLDTLEETPFKLPQSGGYKRFSLTRPLEEVFLDAYFMPEAKNLRSVDSYYLTKDSLLLFQITRNLDHDVSSEGVIELVNNLGVLNKAISKPSFLKLVFVVSNDLYAKFPKQKFHSESVFASDIGEVRNFPCSDVPGIGDKRSRTLASLGVKTIGDLLQAKKSRPEALSSVKSAVEDFEAHLEHVQHHGRISNTQQFVIGLPYNPDDMVRKSLDDMMTDSEGFDVEGDL